METIPEKAISKLAAALKVPEEFIRDMEEADTVTVNIQNNTIENENKDGITTMVGYGSVENSGNAFNPTEAIVRLSDEKAALYERLLKSSQEKIDSLEKRMELLEQLVERKK